MRVKGERIDAVGPDASVAAAGAKVIDLPGTTLTPGLVEGHSHILLHAYNETSWNDQVSHEGLALRVGARDESPARDADGRLHHRARPRHRRRRLRRRRAASRRSTRASFPVRASSRRRARSSPPAATSRRFVPEWSVPQGAEEADGIDSLTRVVRDQIGHGADWIKLYGDYRWGPLPGLASDLLARRDEARRSKRRRAPACRSPSTPARPKGMRRATLAGVETIEHGDDGTPEVFKLMVEHHVALCPTLAAGARRPWPPAGAEPPADQRASARASRRRSTPA